jgi:hypothetical protein
MTESIPLRSPKKNNNIKIGVELNHLFSEKFSNILYKTDSSVRTGKMVGRIVSMK